MTLPQPPLQLCAGTQGPLRQRGAPFMFMALMVKTVAPVPGVLLRLHSRLSRLEIRATFREIREIRGQPYLAVSLAANLCGEVAALGLKTRPAGMPAPLQAGHARQLIHHSVFNSPKISELLTFGLPARQSA